MNAPPWDDQLLTRDGHVSPLALERRHVDAPDPERDAVIDTHLASCARCAAAAAEVEASHGAFDLAPPPDLLARAASAAPVIPLRAERPSRLRAATLWLAPFAVAALALLIAAPWRDDPDTVRLRGGPFDLEVWVHDGDHARPVTTGDPVHPGDRIGFRVKARQDGHLLVLGVDERGHVYVCYPQEEAAVSAPIAATPEPIELEQAMRFDAVPGRERLVGLFCEAPIALSEVAATLREQAGALTMSDALPRLRGDCAQREVILLKSPDPSGVSP